MWRGRRVSRVYISPRVTQRHARPPRRAWQREILRRRVRPPILIKDILDIYRDLHAPPAIRQSKLDQVGGISDVGRVFAIHAIVVNPSGAELESVETAGREFVVGPKPNGVIHRAAHL